MVSNSRTKNSSRSRSGTRALRTSTTRSKHTSSPRSLMSLPPTLPQLTICARSWRRSTCLSRSRTCQATHPLPTCGLRSRRRGWGISCSRLPGTLAWRPWTMCTSLQTTSCCGGRRASFRSSRGPTWEANRPTFGRLGSLCSWRRSGALCLATRLISACATPSSHAWGRRTTSHAGCRRLCARCSKRRPFSARRTASRSSLSMSSGGVPRPMMASGWRGQSRSTLPRRSGRRASSLRTSTNSPSCRTA
mmetsp:Transcript_31090/g.76289  ORF Transcript_31090/g.76289 Transcript_31090/m.76289 type:complete len:248 (-) Transcript_31090:96-839(-)